MQKESEIVLLDRTALFTSTFELRTGRFTIRVLVEMCWGCVFVRLSVVNADVRLSRDGGDRLERAGEWKLHLRRCLIEPLLPSSLANAPLADVPAGYTHKCCTTAHFFCIKAVWFIIWGSFAAKSHSFSMGDAFARNSAKLIRVQRHASEQ